MSASQYGTILRESYGRLVRTEESSDAFIGDFYRLFMSKHEGIRRRFANTDMKRQRAMMKRSIQHMLAFSVTLASDDYLRTIGDRHGRDGLDITPDLYAAWIDALVQAVRLRDPSWSREVEVAWRVGMASGIEFMKSRYEAEA